MRRFKHGAQATAVLDVFVFCLAPQPDLPLDGKASALLLCRYLKNAHDHPQGSFEQRNDAQPIHYYATFPFICASLLDTLDVQLKHSFSESSPSTVPAARRVIYEGSSDGLTRCERATQPVFGHSNYAHHW